MLEVHQFPCLSDNYGFLVHDDSSGETVCIDTPDAQAYLREADRKGWRITQIWNTHWHPDHAGGNEAIKSATGCIIFAAADDADKIAGVDHRVDQGDTVRLGTFTAQVINVGGHTKGHVAYYFPQTGPELSGAAFVGDSLFALGCGRMFEGTPDQFWHSLERLSALPGETSIYCAHEYTQANAAFALHADPDNAALVAYVRTIEEQRSRGEPTVPTILDRERATNPFLRADVPSIQKRWGGASAVETFAAIRQAKDNF
ncbi:MAG: hydroxyacylglutathione hydrolase [Sphingomonadaceae bacterium]